MQDLAALLGDAPDWSALIPHLAELTDGECRAIAPRLAHLPDEAREVPLAWIERALAGAPPAALQLCRSLDLADRRYHDTGAGDEEGGLARLLRAPSLATLTRLTLGLDARALTSSWLARLTDLRALRIATREPFTSALRDEQLVTIAAVPALGRLTLLSLDMVDLRGPGVVALARSSTLTALAELELYAPASATLCKALAVNPAPALRGIRRLALCADRFTDASAGALARASDLLVGLRALEFRVDESCGFDWAEPFSGRDGARNSRRFAGALARLLPALHDCEQVTIEHRAEGEVVRLPRAEFERLADPRALRSALPSRLAGG